MVLQLTNADARAARSIWPSPLNTGTLGGLMDEVGESRRLRMAIVAVFGLASGALMFLQLVVLAMATSHPGLAGAVMIRQRLLATLCSGVASLVVVASAFRRRLPAARLYFLLASACVSLVCGVVLVWRDSKQWDRMSVALAGLTVALLGVAAGFLVVAVQPRVTANRAAPGRGAR